MMTSAEGLLAFQRSLPRPTELRVRVLGEERTVATGTLAVALLPREADGSRVVGATLNRKAISLETPLSGDGELGVLTIADWEGRAIYRRSAAFVLLEAARRLGIDARDIRMGSPLENAQVVVVSPNVRTELATKLFAAMTAVVAEDCALREEVWQVDEARVFFAERGFADASALLRTRRESTVTLSVCGETFGVSMGPVVPRAGYLSMFSVEPHPAGLLLRLGEPVDRTMPNCMDPAAQEREHPRHGGDMADAARAWLNGMGVTSVGSYDDLCVTGRVADLIRVAEGFHEKWIGRIADAIAVHRERVKVIVIAGPSSSGKTTFIKRLTVQLLVDGLRPVNISLDDYYVDREKTVKDETGEYDFEAFEALDSALLQTQLARLSKGERVATAHFDFVAGKSFPSGGPELALGEGDVLLLEGIHGLNPALLGDAVPPESVFRIFVHPATTLGLDRVHVLPADDLRLLRRIVRDRHSRNYTAAETILRWPSVRRGEICHIFPHLPNADAIFDSSLVYEISVLKTYAERYLLEVPSSHPSFTTAFRLRQLIDQFVAIYPDHVPPTSMIREFIGGSGFEY